MKLCHTNNLSFISITRFEFAIVIVYYYCDFSNCSLYQYCPIAHALNCLSPGYFKWVISKIEQYSEYRSMYMLYLRGEICVLNFVF